MIVITVPLHVYHDMVLVYEAQVQCLNNGPLSS